MREKRVRDVRVDGQRLIHAGLAREFNQDHTRQPVNHSPEKFQPDGVPDLFRDDRDRFAVLHQRG